MQLIMEFSCARYILCAIILLVLYSEAETVDRNTIISSNGSTYSKCSSSLLVLERAIYEIEGNKKNLTNTFYPSRKISTAFVQVIYTFQSKFGNNTYDCEVKYWWASGTFLFVQSPTIFRFSSLIFGNKVDNLNKITLTLPYECRPIVQGDDEMCSCKSKDDKLLDILTQQLKLYAKYNDPFAVVRDDTSSAVAVCDSELEDTYYVKNVHANVGVLLFFVITVVGPILFLVLNLAMIRSSNEVIYYHIRKSSNHSDLAALVIANYFLTMYITGLDLASVIYAAAQRDEINSETNHSSGHTFNLCINFILLIYDLLSLLGQFVAFLYLGLQPKWKNKKCFFIYFYCIFENSKENSDSDVNSRKTDYLTVNGQNLFVLVYCMWMFSFSIAGHFLFVIMSWLIDPAQATSIALIYVGSLSFIFVIVRQCFVAYRKMEIECKHEKCCSLLFVCIPLYQLFYKCSKCSQCCKQEENQDYHELGEFDSYEDPMTNLVTAPKKFMYTMYGDTVFDTRAFFAAMGWGFVLISFISLLMVMLFELPLSVLNLPNYLYSIIQILLVVVSLLITYKIFFTNRPELPIFLRHLRSSYRKLKGKKNENNTSQTSTDLENVMSHKYEDVEAIGELAGIIVHNLDNILTKKISTMQDNSVLPEQTSINE